MKNRLRHSLTYAKGALEVSSRQKAIEVIKPVLLKNMGMDICIDKMRFFYEKMIFIQKRLRDKLECRSAKVEVMLTYWDKIYGKL